MSAQSERRHMNGRGPTLLAGKILEQNAWLTSPATSAEPSTSRRPRSSASSAKEKLLGKPKRNSKKSHQPRIQSSGPSTSQQHLSSPSVPMEELENPFSLTPPNNEDSMLLDIHENACDPQIPAPSPPFESSPAESAPVDSAPFPDLQENPEIQEHPTIQLRQSSHLQTRLNDAIYHRYTRPGNLSPDLPNSDDYDNGSDTSSEGDYEAEDISIEEYVESDSESEADFPGEVPSFWNFEEEEFLKAAADLGSSHHLSDSNCNLYSLWQMETSLTNTFSICLGLTSFELKAISPIEILEGCDVSYPRQKCLHSSPLVPECGNFLGYKVFIMIAAPTPVFVTQAPTRTTTNVPSARPPAIERMDRQQRISNTTH